MFGTMKRRRQQTAEFDSEIDLTDGYETLSPDETYPVVTPAAEDEHLLWQEAPADQLDEAQSEAPTLPAYQLRKSRWKASRNWYAPRSKPAVTSTRAAQILNTAIVAAPTGHKGILIGVDTFSNTPLAHDPFTAYELGEISSPNVIVVGDVGTGKSSLGKTCYVERPLIFRNRRAVVVDKKNRGGEGEYCEVARDYGAEPLRFVVGGGKGTSRVNLMDETILAGSGRAGQYRLLKTIAELSNDDKVLDKWEKAALRAAHQAALTQAEAENRPALIHDVLFQLGRVVDARGRSIDTKFDDHSRRALERLHQAGLGVRHLLAALIEDELAGLFDGPTSSDVQLAKKLTVFDVSQLPEDGPAVGMVLAVANVWLMGTLRRQGERKLRTNFLGEEGWHMIEGAGGRLFRSNSKLARGVGLSNIGFIHHIADIDKNNPAIAMIKEAGTAHVYQQQRPEDVAACVDVFNLGLGSSETLANLPQGHHIFKAGMKPPVLARHVRSDEEVVWTNTDEGMLARESGLLVPAA